MDTDNTLYSKKEIYSIEYIHISQLESLSITQQENISLAKSIARVSNHQFNVIKMNKEYDKISLLNYYNFFDDAFPYLKEYWTVDIQEKQSHQRLFESLFIFTK